MASSSKSKSKNRSKILKKYELAYESCIRKAMKIHPRLAKKKPSSLKSRCINKVSKRDNRIKSVLTKKYKRKSISRSPKSRKSRKSRKSSKSSKSRKRSLNPYQKFIKKHANDPKLKNLSPSSRMKAVAKMWKKTQ